MKRSNLRNRAVLALENLESRWCPAITWSNAGGVLSVSGDPAGTLEIGHTANGVWEIIDNGNTLASNISANGGLKVSLNGDDDTLNIRVDGAAPNISGSVTLNTGNGDDTVNFNSSGNVVNLAGMLSINTGNGDDTVNLSSVVGGPVTIQGLANINMGAGLDDALTVPTTVTVQGDLIVQGATGATAVTIDGDVEGKATITFTEAVANTVNIGIGSTLGSLSLIGAAGAETVTLDGDVLASASVYLGNGTNVFDTGADSVIGGSLTYNGGTGIDDVGLAGIVSGSLTANLGASAGTGNVLDTTGTVDGTTNISADGGLTDMNLGGTFAGNVSVITRSTTNTLDFTALMGGARFTYTGGGGVDIVTWAATGGAAILSVNLGAANDTFNLNSTSYNGGTIDGGTGTADNFNSAQPLVGLTVRNFEL